MRRKAVSPQDFKIQTPNENFDIIVENEEYLLSVFPMNEEGIVIEDIEETQENPFHVDVVGPEKVSEINESLNNGIWTFSFIPQVPGKYSVSVISNDQHLPTSPFEINVTPKDSQIDYLHLDRLPSFQFGKHGDKVGEFQNPYNGNINSQGDIIVVDSDNHRIQIFNSNGDFLQQFGTYGSENSQFNHPNSVAVDRNDNLYISDTDNHRIQIFNSKGKFLQKFGTQGTKNSQFNKPYGIIIDSKGNILVCDSHNHRIQIFDSNGDFRLAFGSEGDGIGEFNTPLGIAINSQGNIIVSDTRNSRIQIFDSNGKFLSKFGSEGFELGQFNYPYHLAIDSNDNLLVADCLNRRVQIFDSTTEHITCIGVEQYFDPSGICIDKKNQRIIVFEYANDRISLYNYSFLNIVDDQTLE